MYKSKHPMYGRWMAMKYRCDNPNFPHFRNYGGRGITYDKRWSDFYLFLEDMGNAPSGMTLDRIDNDKGYTKENCRWVTPLVQAWNKRPQTSITYSLEGEQLTMKQLAERAGLSYITVNDRIKKLGWDVKKAVFTPLKR